MEECRRIESLLPPYVDGIARPHEVAEVERHLAGCAPCRSAVAAQRTVRFVLQARGHEIAPPLPPGLRTRLTATLRPRPAASLGWRGKLSAFAAAAVLFFAIVTGLELLSPRSNVLYAAQLAIDHVRCFMVEMATSRPVDAKQMERVYADDYGWQVPVPPSNEETGVRLIAARRCPFWLGNHAHLLYRVGDRQVSLYVDRESTRTNDQLHVLGHAQHIWQHGGNSYAVIARGVPDAELARITAYLRAETQRQ
jgi:anti-sigma factor RsiW